MHIRQLKYCINLCIYNINKIIFNDNTKKTTKFYPDYLSLLSDYYKLNASRMQDDYYCELLKLFSKWYILENKCKTVVYL